MAKVDALKDAQLEYQKRKTQTIVAHVQWFATHFILVEKYQENLLNFFYHSIN